ncbi:MAG TPA: hypothetical protein VHS31_04305, partial [Tepidisphaeraceae bacterium]|nr:hypothetical protein [Tepidisphaeraceae bacterium]
MNSLSVPPPLPGHFALPPISQKPQSTIPPRFYLTFAALFALFVATFLSTISPLNAILWNQPIINPLLTLLTIGLCGSLLLTAIGSPDLKTSTLVSLLTTVFELGVIVDVLEVAAQIADNGMKISLLEPIASALREMRSPEPSWHAFKVCLIFNVCLVAAEEASKLGVVLIFIRLRIIKNPRTALACGALAGL